MPFDPILAARRGEPCLVVDSAGCILAANDEATEMFGREREALLGTFFGAWGPDLDHADLDLIRVRHGLAETSSVRARRFFAAESACASIAFEKLPAEQMSLPEAVGLTALEWQSANLRLSFSQLPGEARVGPEFREMVRKWMIFFRNAADAGDADLLIRARQAEPGWLDLEFNLRQPDPPPLRAGEYESTDLDEASEAVERLRGRFQLRVDYPEISARIRVPQTVADG